MVICNSVNIKDRANIVFMNDRQSKNNVSYYIQMFDLADLKKVMIN